MFLKILDVNTFYYIQNAQFLRHECQLSLCMTAEFIASIIISAYNLQLIAYEKF